jgi:hypothetical protein
VQLTIRHDRVLSANCKETSEGAIHGESDKDPGYARNDVAN